MQVRGIESCGITQLYIFLTSRVNNSHCSQDKNSYHSLQAYNGLISVNFKPIWSLFYLTTLALYILFFANFFMEPLHMLFFPSLAKLCINHFLDPPRPGLWKYSILLSTCHRMMLHLCMWLDDYYKTVVFSWGKALYLFCSQWCQCCQMNEWWDSYRIRNCICFSCESMGPLNLGLF